MNSDVPFGAWLKQQRRARDLSREDLAGQIGCSLSLVEKLETGERRPSRQVAARIALCLAIPVEQRDAFLATARAGRGPHDVGQVPTRTAPTHAVPPCTGRLPAPMTSFIGRAWEVDTVSARLRTPDVRLITLTGAGGVGKTRLALAIGSAVRDAFPDGVWFVNLAPISDSALVLATIAQTLGVREHPGMSPTETLRVALRDQHVLVLLDNFEQVIMAAPELTALLTNAPKLKLLVTSREALHLYGEHVVVVAPLTIPEPTAIQSATQLAQYAAAQLFVARAQMASAPFRLTNANAPAVAAICARLDGLPLAIELAAAWVPLFPPAALLSRLEQRLPMLTRGPHDLSARQRTIRDSIGWSYELLSADEQTLFRRLSVFVGGCTLEAAEGVLRTADRESREAVLESTFGSRSAVLDGLAALVGKSLLRQEEGRDGAPRFTMLEMVREYALERLVESGEAATVRWLHAQFFLALAEAAEPHLRDSDQMAWADRLELEHDNLRAVLAWSRGAEDADVIGLRLAGAVYWFWLIHSHYGEGGMWLDAMLKLPHTTAPMARAKALFAAGVLAANLGEFARSISLQEEALRLYRDLRDAAGIAGTLMNLGRCKTWQGAYTQAGALLAESLTMFQAQHDAPMSMWACMSLGDLAFDIGEVVQARAYFQEALTIGADLEDMFGSAWARANLGRVAHAVGDALQAQTYYAQSLAAFRELGHRRDTAQVYLDLGRVAHTQGDAAQARHYYAKSLTVFGDLMDKQCIPECIEGIAGLAGAARQPAQAARLFGAAESIRESAGVPLPPVYRAAYAHDLAAARAQLDDEAFAAAWAEGRSLTLEHMIAEALAEA